MAARPLMAEKLPHRSSDVWYTVFYDTRNRACYVESIRVNGQEDEDWSPRPFIADADRLPLHWQPTT